MPGTKPTNIIARDFRGSRLYLQSLHTNHGMRWHADQSQALQLSMPEALKVCERASREWGTKCAVLDASGNLATPVAVDPAREFKVYWAPEGRCIATVYAATAREAMRKAPMPYRQYLGEMYAEAQS